MEHVTKKCPYCGEEILAVAKKCKYCGEWLDAEIQETEKPEPATSENKPETKFTTPIDGNTHSKILLVGLIGVAVAFALFWFVKCDSPKTATGKGLKEAVDTAETEDDSAKSLTTGYNDNITPQGVLSVPDAVELVKSGLDFIENNEIREKLGYDILDDRIWYKNCRIIFDEYSNPMPVSAEKESSYAYIDWGHLFVIAYDYSVYEAWLNQLKALGYKETDKSEANYVIVYNYEKDNNPPISISDEEQEWTLTVDVNY